MNHEDYLYWVGGFKNRKGFTVDDIHEYEQLNNICRGLCPAGSSTRPTKSFTIDMLKRNQLIEVANIYDCERDSIDWIYEGISDTHFRVSPRAGLCPQNC